jgi:chromosome segregation ATPase
MVDLSEIIYIFYSESEKKFGEISDQVEKTKRQYDVIDASLDDIKEEVDQYLAWLKDKEEQLTRETPRGYSVKEAEVKLAQNNVGLKDYLYNNILYNSLSLMYSWTSFCMPIFMSMAKSKVTNVLQAHWQYL